MKLCIPKPDERQNLDLQICIALFESTLNLAALITAPSIGKAIFDSWIDNRALLAAAELVAVGATAYHAYKVSQSSSSFFSRRNTPATTNEAVDEHEASVSPL